MSPQKDFRVCVAARGYVNVCTAYWKACWCPWSKLPLEVMLMSVHSLCFLRGLMSMIWAALLCCWCPWSVLPLGATPMFIIQAATSLLLRAIFMSMFCTVTGSHAGAHGPCCCSRQYWGSWLLLRVMLISVVQGQDGGSDLCCCCGACWYQWAMLPPEIILMPVIIVVIGNHVDVHDAATWIHVEVYDLSCDPLI